MPAPTPGTGRNCCLGGVRHQAAVTSLPPSPLTAATVVTGTSIQHGFDCSVTPPQKARAVLTVMSDGTETYTYTNLETGLPMSNASNFTATAPNVAVNIQDDHMFSTNTDSADANYGLSLELVRTDTTTDGVTVTTYTLADNVAGIGAAGDDVTALVTGGAPWGRPTDEEQTVIYGNVNFDVTGASTAMPAVGSNGRVALAGWMRAEINLGNTAAGVRYTTDGSVPSDTNGQLAQDGGVIILTEDEIAAAIFAPVGADGLVDTALTESLSFEQRNIAART